MKRRETSLSSGTNRGTYCILCITTFNFFISMHWDFKTNHRELLSYIWNSGEVKMLWIIVEKKIPWRFVREPYSQKHSITAFSNLPFTLYKDFTHIYFPQHIISMSIIASVLDAAMWPPGSLYSGALPTLWKNANTNKLLNNFFLW